MIENKLKTDKNNGKLGEEKYQVVDFVIFKLVLFPSEAVGIISIEVVNVFVEYKWTKNNFILVILAETLLSLNHYILNGKIAIRCCVSLLFIWIVNHLEIFREVFNNFLWFNIRPILSKEWNDLDEKDEWKNIKHSIIVQVDSSLSCGDKAWVWLIGLIAYISYSPLLLIPKTWGLAKYTSLFKEANFLVQLDATRCNWGSLI